MKPIIGKIYKHFKGDKYMVLNFATHTETCEEYVIYKKLNDTKIWIRPVSMFMSKVDKNKYPNVEQEYRFELVKGS